MPATIDTDSTLWLIPSEEFKCQPRVCNGTKRYAKECKGMKVRKWCPPAAMPAIIDPDTQRIDQCLPWLHPCCAPLLGPATPSVTASRASLHEEEEEEGGAGPAAKETFCESMG